MESEDFEKVLSLALDAVKVGLRYDSRLGWQVDGASMLKFLEDGVALFNQQRQTRQAQLPDGQVLDIPLVTDEQIASDW